MTWLSETSQVTHALAEPAANSDYILQGATSNGVDSVVYMTCGPGDSPQFRVYKVDA